MTHVGTLHRWIVNFLSRSQRHMLVTTTITCVLHLFIANIVNKTCFSSWIKYGGYWSSRAPVGETKRKCRSSGRWVNVGKETRRILVWMMPAEHWVPGMKSYQSVWANSCQSESTCLRGQYVIEFRWKWAMWLHKWADMAREEIP